MPSNHATSRIDMFNGVYQFMSLDPEVINGVLCNAYQDPTYLTFRVFFNFDSEMGLLADAKFKNSALAYLKRIGDDTRYAQLEIVIKMLQAIQDSAFHCFTGIQGLADAYKRTMKEVILNDKTIGLTVTESVDWRFATINTLLKQVLYDYDRMVYVLPLNLQRFNMFVYVTEVRIFQEELADDKSLKLDNEVEQMLGMSEHSFGDTRTEVANYGEDIKAIQQARIEGVSSSTQMARPDDIAVVINAGQYVLFNFGQCAFMPDSGANFVQDIDNTAEPTMATNNIKVSYGTLSISSAFAAMKDSHKGLVVQSQKILSDTDTSETVEKKKETYGQQFVKLAKDSKYGKITQQVVSTMKGQSVKQLLKDAVNKAAKEALEYAKEFALSTAANALAEINMQASRILVGKTVGNVYGLNAVEIAALTNPQFAYSRAKQLLKGSAVAKYDDSLSQKALANPVYEPDQEKSPKLGRINVYEDSM